MPGTHDQVVIIGAGPAGLTAAYELCTRAGQKPVVIEALADVGGISRTIEYKGNRMDIGGHRFFSKSAWVREWWHSMLPAIPGPTGEAELNFVPATDKAMLLRSRLSRILYLRKFFSYPVSLSAETMTNLGPVRLVRIGLSYLSARLFPRKPETNLEDFFINRFGKALYLTFFKDYTEKVWGVPCSNISAAWGAQRIKGLSITKAVMHALASMRKKADKDIAQTRTETSLIDKFWYPKLGPGQLWNEVASRVIRAGGTIHMRSVAERIHTVDGRVTQVTIRNLDTGETTTIPCTSVISTMPVKDLIASMDPPPPITVQDVANALPYRDFITVGVLVSKLEKQLPDNWVYIQEPDVSVGRLQVFNNWSPALVNDPATTWLGLEYFCQEGDALWSLSESEMQQKAIEELVKLGLVQADNVIDQHVVKVPKAYPAYFGAYSQFDKIREYTESISNLYLVGRNGMHRYNNQDHSMITAKLAAEAIMQGKTDKARIWSVNLDADYHEDGDEHA